MSYTQININNIENFVNNKSFEDIKLSAENTSIKVKECKNQFKNLNKLYLLVSEDENNQSQLSVQSNGIILEKDTNKVICMSQNKFKKIESFKEINSSISLTLHSSTTKMSLNLDEESVQQSINNAKFRMEYCEDGTVIRLYNYENNWYTATTKCIDASESFWSSNKTFDDMFWELFNIELLENLDIEYTYIFVLIHKENRIVIDHKYNNLIYINRINNQSKLEDYTNHFYNTDPKRLIRRTKQIDTKFVIHNPLDDYYLPTKRGLIFKFYNTEYNSWDIYQYDFNYYSKIKNIRGNVPLIRIRYLELLNDENSLQLLEENYKESFFLFAMIKHQINNLYKDIHKLYFESHIKHNITIYEDHIYYKTLKQLHAQYKNNLKNNEKYCITLDEVKNKINSLDKNILKKFLSWI